MEQQINGVGVVDPFVTVEIASQYRPDGDRPGFRHEGDVFAVFILSHDRERQRIISVFGIVADFDRQSDDLSIYITGFRQRRDSHSGIFIPTRDDKVFNIPLNAEKSEDRRIKRYIRDRYRANGQRVFKVNADGDLVTRFRSDVFNYHCSAIRIHLSANSADPAGETVSVRRNVITEVTVSTTRAGIDGVTLLRTRRFDDVARDVIVTCSRNEITKVAVPAPRTGIYGVALFRARRLNNFARDVIVA